MAVRTNDRFSAAGQPGANPQNPINPPAYFATDAQGTAAAPPAWSGTGYIPYVPPVTPSATQNQQYTPPNISVPQVNAPAQRPAGVMGNQEALNKQWAWDITTRYNPTTNNNLMANYQEQLNQYQLNGNKRWVGGVTDGHWTSEPPVPPIFVSTDFDQNFNMQNQNTPGMPQWGQANPSYLAPFTQQDPSYAGTLTPFTSANTNMNATYTSLLPDAGKPSTVNFPNGIAPGSGQSSYNMMGLDPNAVVYNGLLPDGSAPRNTAPAGTNFAPNLGTIAPTGNPPPQQQQMQTPPPTAGSGNAQNPAPTQQPTQNNSQNNQLLTLLALLLGQGQKAPSPFWNDNRQKLYTNPGGNLMAGTSQTQTQNPANQALLTLLSQIFG